MTAKLRIKARGIEIEWEGEVDYLKNDLPDLIAAIVQALGITPGDDDEDDEATPLNPEMKFTTAALAAKVQPKLASDLFKVALAKLQLSDKIEPASRAQVHNEMRNAPKFYKPSMQNNLGNTIDSLLGSKEINEPTQGKYTLTPKAQKEIEAKL
jgi:hypothetical protein